MATNYTSEYQLCQWDQSDPVQREEFNQDNSRIEAGFVGLLAKLEEVKTSISQEVGAIEAKIQSVEENITTVSGGFTQVEESIAKVEQSILEVEKTVNTVENNISTVASSVSAVESSLSSVETSVSGVVSELSSVSSSVEAMSDTVTPLTGKVLKNMQVFHYAGTGVQQSFSLDFTARFGMGMESNKGLNPTYSCLGTYRVPSKTSSTGTSTVVDSNFQLSNTTLTVGGTMNVSGYSYIAVVFGD